MKRTGLAVFCVILSAALVFIGCDDEKEDDLSISKVTIYNIPAKIPVYDNETKTNDTYKVYINASNTQNEDDEPATFGLKILTNDMKQPNGTYTVTLDLQKPIPGYKEDPNDAGQGAFRGTANYFSLMIVPADVSADKENSIWVKGSSGGLNKSQERIDWTDYHLMNFRTTNQTLIDNFEFPKKTKALFDAIVKKDRHIKGSDTYDGGE